MAPSRLKALFVSALTWCLLFHPAARGGVTVDAAGDTAQAVIDAYRTDDPAARVRIWQSEITHPSGNPKFKEFQAERLRE
jgi:hypothetical protein